MRSLMTKKPQQNPHDNSAAAGLKSFLDTSVTFKHLTGHSVHKARLAELIPPPRYVNNYVRMEFYRALLMSWIHFYFEAVDPFHPTFADALLFYSDSFGREGKRVLTAVGNIVSDAGLDLKSSSEKESCLHKLEDLIFEVAYAFDLAYKRTGADPTRCARVPFSLRVVAGEERRDTIRRFEEIFSNVNRCRAGCDVEKFFQGGKYAEQLRAVAGISQEKGAHPAIVRMDAPIARGNSDPSTFTCFMCGKIGDAIIAISVPSGWRLHSLDTVHEPICQILGREFQICPSAAAVKKSDSDGA